MHINRRKPRRQKKGSEYKKDPDKDTMLYS